MIIRGRTDHMEIALNTDSKEITVTQKWKLNFINPSNNSWTSEEKVCASWHLREIALMSSSLLDRKELLPSVAHEFGHAFGNTWALGNMYAGDEYYCDHPTFNDKNSIMNKGNELRHRHFTHIRDLLQQMLPSSYFCIRLS